MQRYICVILRREFNVKIPITLQNVRARQPLQITLVESSFWKIANAVSIHHSQIENQIEKSGISLQTHFFSARCPNIHADVQLDQKSVSKCD